MENVVTLEKARAFEKALRPLMEPNWWRAAFQLGTTFPLYVFTLTIAMHSLSAGHYGFAFLSQILTGLLIVRIFIFQHDCGHWSYVQGRRANRIVGHICSMVTVVPFLVWRDEHGQHHNDSGNLDSRGVGDIDVLTVAEYLALSLPKKLRYRTMRNPLFLFFIGGPTYFLLFNRVPWGRKAIKCKIWPNIVGLNCALGVYLFLVCKISGHTFLVVGLTMLLSTYVASVVGTWLFYVQHQFDRVRWHKKEDWNLRVAALDGSSHYDLHPILRWFTGSIGLHHIHHLSTRIPNYNLVECLKVAPELRRINRITFWESLSFVRLKLWDEDQQKMVGYPT